MHQMRFMTALTKRFMNICKGGEHMTKLFVNDTSFGAETANGDMMHIYIDELMDLL